MKPVRLQLNGLTKGLLAILLVALFISCKKEAVIISKDYFKGPDMNFLKGRSWSWVQLRADGTPERMGVAINDAALQSIKTPSGPGSMLSYKDSIILPLHPMACKGPFNHVALSFHPEGDKTPGSIDEPHFHFRFYMSTEEERKTIPAYAIDSLGFLQYPADGYLPPHYQPLPGGMPMVGAEWTELGPGDTGKMAAGSFRYGTFNGRVTYLEPMATMNFLRNSFEYERAIPQPSRFEKAGYYPALLRIVRHEDVTSVILDHFIYRLPG